MFRCLNTGKKTAFFFLKKNILGKGQTLKRKGHQEQSEEHLWALKRQLIALFMIHRSRISLSRCKYWDAVGFLICVSLATSSVLPDAVVLLRS